MMNPIRNSCSLIVLIFLLIFSTSGCKSKKKAMEAAAAEKARIEQEAKAKKQLEEEAAQRKLAEERLRREQEEARQKEMEAKANAAPKARLSSYFEAIAGSNSIASANNTINEALALFTSPQVPVLIVISEEGGQKDYDRPTTIKDYLNYLKDQKKNSNTISNLQFDGSGKITELELRKGQ